MNYAAPPSTSLWQGAADGPGDWSALVDAIPGGVLAGAGSVLLVLLVLLAVMANSGGEAGRKEFNKRVEETAGVAARGVGRFLAGRDLVGEPRSEATWWRAGAPLPDDQLSQTAIGRLGAKPKIPAPRQKDSRVRPGGWARAGRGLTETGRVLAGAGVGIWRVARMWHRWPQCLRALVRLAPLIIAWGWWRDPGTTQTVLIAVGAAAVVAAVTGPCGLRRWRVKSVWSDGQIYGPGVWAGIRQILWEEGVTRPRRRWLEVPADVRAEGARIVLRVPVQWLGGPKGVASVERVIEERVEGDWMASWSRTGREHYVQWALKPKPKPKPKLPVFVPWQPTGDPRRLFLGLAIEGDDVVQAVLSTRTSTPHWGVAGDTGSGKSTILYIPIVGSRQGGEVIDVIDTKRNSLREAEGFSGVRVHKDIRDCVAAFAEFLVSMMAAEAAKDKGADPELSRLLVGRTLVIDELPTLVKLAYTWWRYGLGGKGTPPFLEWLGIILLQGRSSDHRVVVGTQQFANAYFGGTMERSQIGTRVVVGGQERSSWSVAFGASTPVIPFDTTVPGRGAYSDKRMDPEEGHLFVRELQPCYITPQVPELLAQCPPAPAWFDRGEPAPWITPEILEAVNQFAATAEFMPGGKFGPVSPTAVAGSEPRGVLGGSTRSQGTTAAGATADATAGATADGAEAVDAEAAELPETYTLAEAYEREVLPWKAATARTYFKRGVDRGIEPPAGVSDGHRQYYSEAELLDWLAKWQAWQKVNKKSHPGTEEDE
jgi:hypothetical protein